MSDTAISSALVQSLKGERGHLPIHKALPDISWELAGKTLERQPHTIYELLSHMNYWQAFLLRVAQDEKPQLPSHVMESWPSEKNAVSETVWKELIDSFLKGVDQAIDIAKGDQLHQPLAIRPEETRIHTLRNIASHNSYHLGQIVFIRRLFSEWPPPSGGYPA
ncbi:DinB family protein [Marininema halotolerans]|uniref:Uncharacterized damage-inducible protein DinB (Forms a four-helix bundle) n=1 Tax=Marininema halotolerans TaxID=1155944 RepID=A0A1I6NUD6_9BACL|nr:DinB family protein [Marininema halotolerans]SFS31541.1 Uncharacterized damage-inducible protein DinB (forms a four-helix bundle) [Marininema halotolerans]